MRTSLYNFASAARLEEELNKIEPKGLRFEDLPPAVGEPVCELPENLKRLYAVIRVLERKGKQGHRNTEKKQEIGLMSGLAQALFDAEFREFIGENRRLAPFVVHRDGFVCARSSVPPSPQR